MGHPLNHAGYGVPIAPVRVPAHNAGRSAEFGIVPMTVSYFVRYSGAHQDDVSFTARYRDVHVPILLEFPAIRSVVLRTPLFVADRYSVSPASTHLLAEMQFDDQGGLQAALESSARARAREDFARMPAFHGTIEHEALREQVFLP